MEEIGAIDLICGGFPCQPFSVAGKQRGEEDDRHLWPEYFRLIQEIRPDWVIGENVAGLISMGLDQVLSDLESANYSVETFIIPACAVNAPHRRERVWIIAYNNGARFHKQSKEFRPKGAQFVWENVDTLCKNVADSMFQPTQGNRSSWKQVANLGQQKPSSKGRQPPFREWGHWSVEPGVGRVVDGLSAELDLVRRIKGWCHEKGNGEEKKPAFGELAKRILRKMWEQRKIAETSPQLYFRSLRDCVPEVPLPNTYSRWLLGARIEKDQGLRDLWEEFYSEPFQKTQKLQFKLLERAWEKKRQKTVGSRADRLKQLGNAVVPQVVEVIGRAIMEIEKTKRS